MLKDQNHSPIQSQWPKYLSIATKLLNCGMIGGVVQAFVFNPWDRALYLSVINSRPFLDRRNFLNPWKGVVQTIVQRSLSTGLYFPLEDMFNSLIAHIQKEFSFVIPFNTFLAGCSAGAINGLLLNPSSAVKYHYWGKVDCGKESFFTTAKSIFRTGGIRPFFVGAKATIYRDIIFGGVFSITRHEVPKLFPNWIAEKQKNTHYEKVIINLFAGMFATILSSPLNYVRNMHYATPPNIESLSIRKHLHILYIESMKYKDWKGRLSYAQKQLRIGWGTARVGCGMTLGSFVYTLCTGT